MLSTTFPVRCAVAPHELLPIIPPRVQFMWVEGRGPKLRPGPDSCSLSTSRTMPGSTTQVRAPTSTETRRLQYLDQSSTTAVLVHCPARLVPPPRDRTGAPCSRHTATASAAASTVRGTTTPIGTCRKFDPSVEYAARLPASNLTSPSTRSRRSCSSRPGSGGLSGGLTDAGWVALIVPPARPCGRRRCAAAPVPACSSRRPPRRLGSAYALRGPLPARTSFYRETTYFIRASRRDPPRATVLGRQRLGSPDLT